MVDEPHEELSVFLREPAVVLVEEALEVGVCEVGLALLVE